METKTAPLPQFYDNGKLPRGADFRDPKYREEVFLRFYEFHIRYRAHPGGVYYAFPWLFEEFNLTQEQRLWFAYINGLSQNVVTTFTIWQEFPDLATLDLKKLDAWFNLNWSRLGWDMDRRYVKAKFVRCVELYRKLTLDGVGSQESFFNIIMNTNNEQQNFNNAWGYVMKNFAYFGRLSTFSYLEYLRIVGLKLDCDQLFLDDMSGSKSHRNGLAKVMGRDDLDWWAKNPRWQGYKAGDVQMLAEYGAELLEKARQRIDDPDVGYFTLESTLCCYKSWHRPNRRYPNVYNDMFALRIADAQRKWGKAKDLSIFWRLRRSCLPEHLLTEINPKDSPLKAIKQNHYLMTGQVVMMDKEWECFRNDYNDAVRI